MDDPVYPVAGAPFDTEMLIHLSDRQVGDDARNHVEIGATDLTHILKGKSDHSVLVKDEVALGIHHVRHIPGVDAQQPLALAEETDLQKVCIMKTWYAPEPLDERIAAGNVMQSGNGSPHEA